MKRRRPWRCPECGAEIRVQTNVEIHRQHHEHVAALEAELEKAGPPLSSKAQDVTAPSVQSFATLAVKADRADAETIVGRLARCRGVDLAFALEVILQGREMLAAHRADAATRKRDHARRVKRGRSRTPRLESRTATVRGRSYEIAMERDAAEHWRFAPRVEGRGNPEARIERWVVEGLKHAGVPGRLRASWPLADGRVCLNVRSALVRLLVRPVSGPYRSPFARVPK